MEISITAAVVGAVVTGAVTGIISSMGTVSAIRVHIQYLRETLQKHDDRLRDVERDTRMMAARIEKAQQGVTPTAPTFGHKPGS